MQKRPVYLDNNATTEVDPLVLEAMLPWLRNGYGNPSSAYGLGRAAAAALDTAREQVAAVVGAHPEEILFTSCGSESINTAIRSALSHDPDRAHAVTSAVEHSATMKLADHLAKKGYEITRLPVDSGGGLDLDRFERSIRDDTAIVSLLWANNETGVLFPIDRIAAICEAKRVPLHIDAVQAVGKIPVDLSRVHATFLSLSGHKIYCPKGVAALYVRRRSRFTPWLFGGSQESNRRGGTQNVASIVALGKAAEIAADHLLEESGRVRELRDAFEATLLAEVPGSHVNGSGERLPNTTNMRFEGVESEAALVLLDKQSICCSAGSACTAGSVHPSHVLTAMGLSRDHARASLRFSFGRFNDAKETADAARTVASTLAKLRALDPVAS